MLKFFLLMASILFGLGIVWVLVNENAKDTTQNINSLTNALVQEENVQRIEILARGGYTPNQINAVANKETILNIVTKGTYDCSSSIVIPTLNYRNNLPPTGSTQVRISAAQATNSIEILCGMGMYSATIHFES